MTKKFITELKLCFSSCDLSQQTFRVSILEKCFESICTKFRRRLTLIKQPLRNLLNDIEIHPEISGLKKLSAVKKSIVAFEQDVDKVSKILKAMKEETPIIGKLFTENDNNLQDIEEILDFLIR